MFAVLKFYCLIVLCGILHLSCGFEDNEIKDRSLLKTEMKGLVEFLDNLADFYVHGGLLVYMQTEMLNMNNSEDAFSSINEFVSTLEWKVDTLIKEANAKKGGNPAKILQFFITRFVKVRDEEIKEVETMLFNAFQGLKNSSQKRLNDYIGEREEQKRMVKLMLNYAQDAKIDLKQNSIDQYEVNQDKLGLEFYYAARVFLPFAKTAMISNGMYDDINYDYSKEFEILKKESNNRKEIMAMILELTPQFQRLTSNESQWEWIANKTRTMFDGRILDNIKYSVTKSSGIRSKSDAMLKKMEERLNRLKEREEAAKKKLTEAEHSLGQVVGAKVKIEL